MAKKKKKGKKSKKVVYDLKAYEDFASYSKNRNEYKMEKLRFELDDLISDVKKSDKKYERLKKKVKKGKKPKSALKEYRKNHVVHSRRRALEFVKSTDFITLLGSLIINARAIVQVISQMLASLIVLLLSCKKFRESIPINVVEKLQSTYDFCLGLA